jgi:hypothetical protein
LPTTVVYPEYAAGTLPKSIMIIFEALDESFIEFQTTFPEKQVTKVIMPTPNQQEKTMSENLENRPQVRSQEPVEELLAAMGRAPTSNLEVSDTGAFREKTDYMDKQINLQKDSI